jgi:hypothetical protein
MAGTDDGLIAALILMWVVCSWAIVGAYRAGERFTAWVGTAVVLWITAAAITVLTRSIGP